MSAPAKANSYLQDHPFARKECLELTLRKYGVIKNDIASDERLVPDLAAEEKELAGKTNFKNAASLDALTRVRVKRELLPTKIASGRDQLKAVEDEIGEEVETVRNLLDDRLNAVYSKLVSRICVALRPFFSGHVESITQGAHAAACHTSAGVEIQFLEGFIRATKGQSVFMAANNLLKIFERVFRAWPDMEFQDERFHLKTHGELEREELASLLENPEPHILQRLSQTGTTEEGAKPLFTREQAEKIVEGRLNYLLSAHPDLAPERTANKSNSRRK